MIQTILTPIDGSIPAQMALDLSTDLAARYDTQLILLHVGGAAGDVPEVIYNAALHELEEVEKGGQETGIPAYQPRHLQVLEYMGRMLLRNAREQAEGKGVKNVETIIDVGDPGDRIIQRAKERSADLIVMGSRGFGNLKGLVLGSVSHKVFHLAPCSCVTVNRRDGQPPLDGVDRMVVPTDGSAQSAKAVELASEIAGKYGAKMILLYVMWRGPSLEQLRASVDTDQLSVAARDELDPAKHPVAEHLSSGFMPPVVSKGTLTEIGEQVLERGRKTAEANGVQDLELVLRDGDPARTIVGVAEHQKADMIAMGSRGLSGVEGFLTGSVSYKVNHSAPCSCLIVR